jgi:hypothetical protein
MIDTATISLIVSVLAMVISGAAYRQARKTGSLQQRREAINLVRSAFTDVTLHAHIDDRTVANIREAYQISLLVLSKRVSDKLTKLAGICVSIGTQAARTKNGKRFGRRTHAR